MKLQILAIRDRAIDAFGQPMFFTNVGGGIRSFGDEIQRQGDNNMMAKHPDDFDLYHLGEYDDATGHIEQLDQPKQVAIGKQFTQER